MFGEGTGRVYSPRTRQTHVLSWGKASFAAWLGQNFQKAWLKVMRGIIGGKRQRGNHKGQGEDGISRAAQAQGTVTPSMTGAVAKNA